MPFDSPSRPLRLGGHPRAFLRSLGYVVADWSGGRTVKAFLHDNACHCGTCGDWFCSAADMADDRDAECFWCRWSLWKPGEKEASLQALADAAVAPLSRSSVAAGRQAVTA